MVGKIISVPSFMDMYETFEMFSRYYVDPIIAQARIPNKWRVKIQNNGMALMYILIQKCHRMVLNKILNVGQVGMSHIWIEIDGPPEVVSPFPGTTRALPTWYWYTLPHQTDNRLAAVMFSIAGISNQPVWKISLEGEPGGTRCGKVIEKYSSEVGYSWTETSNLYAEPEIVTGSHRVFRKQGLKESEAHVKCFTHFLGDGQVTLNATRDSTIGKLGFGTSLTGITNPVLVKYCKVKYKVGFSL